MSVENKDEFVFTWKIENYSTSPHEFGEVIESPPFTAESISNCKWVLLMYPKNSNASDEYKSFARCALRRKEADKNSDLIQMDYLLEMLRDDGSVLKSRPWIKILLGDANLSNNEGYGWTDFVNIDYLANEMKNWINDDLTLRCRMVGGKKRGKHEAADCKAVSRIGLDRGSFKWEIWSPEFTQWSECITICVPGISKFEITLTALDEYIAIAIRWLDASALVHRAVKFHFTFLDKSGMIIDTKKESHLFNTSDSFSWNFPSFMKKERLEKEVNGLAFFDFNLNGEVTASNKTVLIREMNYFYTLSAPRTIKGKPDGSRFSSLQNSFRELFNSKKHSDVILRIGENVFQAHKTVLAARSPVFFAMFVQKMSDCQTGIVEVRDMDSETMSKFLEYIYTDTVDKMDYETIKTLLVVADKYEVNPLKEKCADFLMSVLAEENVCDVTIIAKKINHNFLLKFAINFIKINASKILQSPDWLEFIKNNHELATDIFIMLSQEYGSVTNTM